MRIFVHRAFLPIVTFLLACGGSNATGPTPPTTIGTHEAGTWIDLAGGGRGYFVAAPGEGSTLP